MDRRTERKAIFNRDREKRVGKTEKQKNRKKNRIT